MSFSDKSTNKRKYILITYVQEEILCVLNEKIKFWLNVDTILTNHLRFYDSTYLVTRSIFRGSPNVSGTVNIKVSMLLLP